MSRDYSGYLRRISMAYTLYGMLPATWQIAIVAALSVAGTSLGYVFGDPFRSFVGLMAGFGLGSMGFYFTLAMTRNATVFAKLGLGSIGITNVSADIKANVVKEFYGITVNFTVINTGVRDVYFRFLRTDLSITNLVNQDAYLTEDTHLVPAGFPQSFTLPTIQNIKVPPAKPGAPTPIVGKLKLQFAYGPRRDRWAYAFNHEADLSFTWIVGPMTRGHQTAQVIVTNTITKNAHEVYRGA